jgi:HK97 family phage prohead protease
MGKAYRKEIAAMEQFLVDHSIATIDFLDKQQRRRKAIEQMGDVAMNAGRSFDESERILVFYAARFTGDKPDAVNDVIDPGAFDSWLRKWRADPLSQFPTTRGKMPIVVAHGWDDFSKVVGWASPDDVTVDARGLLVAAHLFNTPEAKKVWETARDLGMGASFAFEVAKGGERQVKRNGKTFNLLLEFSRVLECGPCLFGAEPTAGTVEVKAADRVFAEFDNVVRRAARSGSKVAKAILSESNTGSLAKSDPRRCESCGAFQVEAKQPVVDGHAAWTFCTNCSEVVIMASKSWSQARIKSEADLIFGSIKVIDLDEQRRKDRARANRIAAEDRVKFEKVQREREAKLNRGRERRDVAELLAFATAKPKNDVKPKSRDAVREFDSLFGGAPDIDPKEIA